MRWLSVSTSANSGATAARISGLSSAASSVPTCPRPHLRNRSPNDFVNPRAAFTSVGPCPDQHSPRPDHGQVRLRFRAPVTHRAQQARIDARQARQGLAHPAGHPCAYSPRSDARSAGWPRSLRDPTPPVAGSPTASDHPASIAIRHRAIAPNAFAIPAFVGRQRFLPRSPLLPHPARNNGSIDLPGPSRSSLSCFRRLALDFRMLIFFIAGLLSAPQAHLWELIASRSETGLLIPSVWSATLPLVFFIVDAGLPYGVVRCPAAVSPLRQRPTAYSGLATPARA